MNIGNIGRQAPPPPTGQNGPQATATATPAPAERALPGSGAGPATPAPAPVRGQARPSDTPRAESQGELSREAVENLVERISRAISIEQRSLSFTIDDDLGRTIVRVIDRETDEVIRQIPSEEVLRIAQAIGDVNERRTEFAEARQDVPAATGLLIREQA